MKLFKNLVIFDYKSITVQDNTLKDTEAFKGVGRQIPVSVSITSNLLEKPVFFCNEKPLTLIREFFKNYKA